ncbi:hypothetical protein OKA06_01575 [Novosphingobium sp. MW5]|nr:hypothetical protein [Novosphingobium sp. MW5]
MTSKLQQFFADTGTLAQVTERGRLDNSDLFFNPVEGGFDICVDTRIRFEYREKTGVSCFFQPGTTKAELELWHKGSVMGLAAWCQGLVALHVSAVQCGKGLVAMAGDSGAGKSTLAAALGTHGYPLFADDTLILDRQDGAFVAMPGHKKLKLWDNAFELTGAVRAEQLQPGIEKYFAQNASTSSAALLPLTDLVLLTETDAAQPHFRQIRGAEKIKRCADALYRPDLYAQIAKGQDHAALMLELSTKVRIWEFGRSRNRELFAETTRFLARNLAGLTDSSVT